MRRTDYPPLGQLEYPGEVPTLDDWRWIKQARCRRLLAAHHTKMLGAAVYREFGEASRAVLAENGIRVESDGTVHSAGEDQVNDQFREFISAMRPVYGAALKLPCDVELDPGTGAVRILAHSHDGNQAVADGRGVVVPLSHDRPHAEGGGTDAGLAGHAN